MTALNFTSSGFILSHSVVFSNYQETSLFITGIEKLLKNLTVLLRQRNTSVLCCQWRAHEGPNAQEKAESLMAATVHLLEDVMDTFHQPGVNGEARPQQGVHDKRMCRHILALCS